MLWFQGTFYNLGERYTVSRNNVSTQVPCIMRSISIFNKLPSLQDLTKILFVVFFYSSLFPFVWVFGFVILSLQYMVDRFSLFRIWGWNPQLGAELASFSRKYMILGCLAVFAVISSFVFAQFPYDNVCDPPNPVTGVARQYLGVRDANGEFLNEGTGSDGIAVVFQDTSVQFCDQSRGGSDEFWFPATKRVQGGGLNWFGDEQVSVVMLYSC